MSLLMSLVSPEPYLYTHQMYCVESVVFFSYMDSTTCYMIIELYFQVQKVIKPMRIQKHTIWASPRENLSSGFRTK